jgi:hypothetical protein
MVEEGGTVVTTGTGQGRRRSGEIHRFCFCDVFVFDGDLVGRVESYLVPLGQAEPTSTSPSA